MDQGFILPGEGQVYRKCGVADGGTTWTLLLDVVDEDRSDQSGRELRRATRHRKTEKRKRKKRGRDCSRRMQTEKGVGGYCLITPRCCWLRRLAVVVLGSNKVRSARGRLEGSQSRAFDRDRKEQGGWPATSIWLSWMQQQCKA